MALQFAAQELQACRGLVLRAVSNCGMALQFGSDGLKADVEVLCPCPGNCPTWLGSQAPTVKYR
eukprot:1089574-Amphidinium_carterae.1